MFTSTLTIPAFASPVFSVSSMDVSLMLLNFYVSSMGQYNLPLVGTFSVYDVGVSVGSFSISFWPIFVVALAGILFKFVRGA